MVVVADHRAAMHHAQPLPAQRAPRAAAVDARPAAVDAGPPAPVRRARVDAAGADVRARRAALALLALGSTGCAPTVLTSYLIDLPFLRAHSDLTMAAQPTAPPQTYARYTLAASPLRVVCQTESSQPLAMRTQAHLDGVGRAVIGFIGAGETVSSIFLIRDAVRNSNVTPGILAGFLLADAAFAFGYAILAPTKSRIRTVYGRSVPVRHGNCPSGLTVVTGGRVLPVDPLGRIPGGSATARVAVDFGASISFGGKVTAWCPSPQEKCALAHESAHPNANAICGAAPRAPLPVPPPPAGGMGLPAGAQWNGSVSFP